ncbi:trafficking protein particle complex subunit 6A isoform X4 [Sarcophilus harrisii]|uniref:trafficking protein particle complex subunit 6A isoform X4 n=1 Tax=Sarcophilus harrisii TaxID=9305 RepID=UPI001301C784|nr:trafficking protein particle complex subunit 6A isoform X4 [Sarcophilus harrisii]
MPAMADETLFQLLHTQVVAAAYGAGRGSGDEGLRAGLTVLEGMGFRVGQGLAERDLWGAVFGKQTDNLRTNHQGTYILQDNNFPFLTQMAWGQQYLEEAPKVLGEQFLAFTCGLLRGTLSSLGIESSVTASVTSLPACKFQVVIQKA